MRIIARSTLRAYWQKHPDTEQPLKAWFDDTSRANWKTPSDIKDNYANASIIANNRVVFNIKGNNHRLIVHIRYDIKPRLFSKLEFFAPLAPQLWGESVKAFWDKAPSIGGFRGRSLKLWVSI